ncbi:MAG: gliding motility-associated C-terminal domain-containing protein, partial [Bacteroidota bacterium]
NGDIIDPMNLCAGIYTIIVLDTNECFVTLEDTLFQPEPLELDSVVYGENFCSYDTLVSAVVDITGGSPGFSIDWTHIVGTNDPDSVTGLEPGTYPVIVTDINGCESDQMNVEITGPPPIDIDTTSVTQITCFGFMDGAIDITLSGGTGTLNPDWDHLPPSTDPIDVTGLDIGIYQLMITDDNGCLDSISVEISQPDALSLNVISNPEATCGEANGSIDISVSGGTQGYDYDWNCDGILDAEDVLAAVAGDTTLCITDMNGCMLDTVINVPGIEGTMSLDVIKTDVTCAGDENGEIMIVVDNGTPNFDYEWVDFPGENTPMQSGLSGGSYEITVTDLNDCVASSIIVVGEPDSLEMDITPLLYGNGFNVSCLGCCDGSIEGFTFGGTSEYTYQWTGDPAMVPANQDTMQSPTSLCEGEYCVTVTDANGCEFEVCTRLEGPDEIIIPGGISPNGDGLNDALIIEGIDGFPDNTLQIFNRWGNLVYERVGYNNSNPWDGQNDGNDNILPDGTYYLILLIPDANIEFNEYVELRR